MNRNPSAKSEFLKNKDAVAGHTALLDNPYFLGSIKTALSQMQMAAANNTDASNFNQCAAAHLRMLGAQDFVDILLNLSETQTIEARRDTSNLPGNVASLPRKN